MGLLHEDFIGSSFQCVFVFVREGPIASVDKIMVESGIGVPRRADGHDGEVEVIDGVGGDRGGDRILLPRLIGLANEDSSCYETKTNH